MTKKQICLLLAIVVSCCAAVCLIVAAISVYTAVISGAGAPWILIFLAAVTALCAGMIWSGWAKLEP